MVICLAEGFSEANLVDRLLAPHLGTRGVDMYARIVTTRRDRKAGRVYKGGGRTIDYYLNDLADLYRQWQRHPRVWFTTCLDVYKLPNDFPDRQNAFDIKDCRRRVERLEELLTRAAVDKAGMDEKRFIPHLALHEFETLLFADLDALGTLFPGREREIGQLKNSVAAFDDIEEINHTENGAPSSRIGSKIPVYGKYKASDQSGAINVLEVISLPKIRGKCRHFDAWVTRLEQLAS
ncbi:MAG: DUF4276 family protein [Opitutaceae bacterium]|jgi:hypothetical protein|nr:DUF4276 family protein [Opitutaceae bacterium]